MRNFLRFPIDWADQDRITLSTIQVEDAPGGPNALPVAQSLGLKFRIGDPAAGPPQLRPFFPGRMVFIPDPGDSRIQPTAAQVDFAQWSTWRTAGTLLVIHVIDKAERDLKNLAPSGLLVAPNMVWYAKIHLTRDFLQTTLAAHKQKIPGLEVSPFSPDWIKHAVAGFLRGTFLPELRLGATASDDDATKLPMPVLDMTAQGDVALDISMARGQSPRDALDGAFDTFAGGLPSADPRHPRNGRIPARLVFRFLEDKIIDGALGVTVADDLIQPPNDLSYLKIRFTRIWKPEEDVSAYFPAHTVEVGRTDPVRHLFTAPLPAHGIVYAPVPIDDFPLEMTVKITGPMRWVDGRVMACWAQMGDTAQFTFQTSGTPHIQMRRRMSEEMDIEPAYSTDGLACTYYSLRRSVRALVNNRIVGGRLNHNRTNTSKAVAKLIDDAFGIGNTDNAKAAIVANNAPRTNVKEREQIKAAAETLIPILNRFFPGDAPPQLLNGSTSPVNSIRRGRLFYDLWQSAARRFEDPMLARNYPNAHIGRGAPGALVALGLGSYHVTGERNAGEGDADYFDRLVKGLMTGLARGDVIQFWNLEEAFKLLKNRQWMTSNTDDLYGHSPVYYGTESSGSAQAVNVFDQMGISECTVINNAGKLRLAWNPDNAPGPTPEEVWIAAKWIE